ncbi:HlyD family efflux transporter periplasmic adaptor subunit [Cytophaga aurantiaca]|uniref:HlyD family efflux transporter periplasmic adaptor subunit n=1 Tax=Cytophaga aurantiaca TaxID=29530 RepID=UPI00037AEE18|nr:efflux RND transporter periplasmic adaptor subunit [Cytophaga aurantiaca]
MKNNFKFINQMLRILLILLVFASCNKGKQNTMDKMDNMDHDMHEHSAMYSCPMHPEITSDKPGTCPKCGMNLVLIPQKNSIDTLATLIQPTNRVVLSELTAIVPSTENHGGRIGALGYLTYNPNYVNTISARVSGRVEKMYVKYNFEAVKKGQKLLDLYSPELLTAQNEYLFILQTNDATDEFSKVALRSKMINLGMNEKDIANLEKTKQANARVSIYANANGHIHFVSDNTDMEAHALSFPSQGNTTTMGGGTNTAMTELIREGDYVKKGDDLFTIADESSIWALFKVLPSDIGSIQKGDAVDIIINATTYSGKVDFIEKSFNNAEDFYTVRVYMICNDHSQLKIGTLIRGYISTKNNKEKNLWIPTASVVQLGKGNAAVFIKKQLAYEAHKIQTGKQSFEWIEVLSGLNTTDSIAPVASYLVDSEAFISTDNN